MKKILIASAVVVLFTGCADTLKSRNQNDFDQTRALIEAQQEQAKSRVRANNLNRIAAQDVNQPYVAGQSIDISREVNMPTSLRQSMPVTAYFANSQVDIGYAMSQLSQATGLSITALPEVYQPASNYEFKTSVEKEKVANAAPTRLTLKAVGKPIWEVLDDLAAQMNASWRPTPTGAVFYRVETKSYELMTIPQIATTTASLGRTGSAQNAFNSDSKTSFEMKGTDQIEGIRTTIESLMTRAGKFTISRESQTLIVTDTPQAQKLVEEYIKRQNKIMSRRVRLLIEAIDIVAKEGTDFGIDWNLVYNTTKGALSGASPSGLASAQAGTINFQQMYGPLAGSGLVIKALNEVGTVVNRRVFPVMTTSGRPITQALRTTFNYVDQVQTTSVASSVTTAVQAPTVTQKDETVGTFLTIVPTAKNDGSIFLSVSYDVTTADPLRPYTVGSGASAVTVQQKTINGSGVIQEVAVRNGRTEVIGGIELSTHQNTNRRLGDGIPIIAGGSNSSSLTKSLTVILVTAVTEEGV